MVKICVLGSTDLRGPEGQELHSILAQPKRLALLTYLAVARPRGFHRRDKLLAMFWPELDQEHARGALRKALYFLRGSLGDAVLEGRGDEEVGLEADAFSCDVLSLEAAAQDDDLEAALDLYRGELLEGLFVSDAPAFEQWLDSERLRLVRLAARAAIALASREEAAGHTSQAIVAARRATALLPHDELTLRSLMEVLDRAGDRVGAIRAYEDFVEDLRDQLELEPSPETNELAETIRLRSESNGRAAVEEMAGDRWSPVNEMAADQSKRLTCRDH